MTDAIKGAQSALEYMMTYGWALIIIAVVIGILYLMGIFNPTASVSATVSGFSNLGQVSAVCYSNGVLRISFGNSGSQLIEITTVSVSVQNATTVVVNTNSTVNSEPFIPVSGAYVFSVPGVCPAAKSHYSLSVTVYYSKPEAQFPGPFTSYGTITGSSSSTQYPAYVLDINNFANPVWSWCSGCAPGGEWYLQGGKSYMNATQSISGTNNTYTIIMWVQSAYFNYSSYYPQPPNSSSYILNSIGIFSFEGYDTMGVGGGVGGPHQNYLFMHRCSSADTPISIQTSSFFGGKWTFVAVSVKAPNYYAQIDGSSSTATNSNSYTGGPNVRIGDEFQQCAEGPFIGYISNVQLYSVSLSPAQINQAYMAGILGNPVVTNSSLVAWWPLNGTAHDFSGHGYNGQLVGASFTSDYQAS